MKFMLSVSKDSITEECSRKEENGTLQKFGGCKHEKSTR